MPNGEFSGGGSPDSPLMVIHRPDDFAARVGDSGLIGFGESYMAGDWEASDLTAVLEVFASRVATLIPDFLQRLRGLYIPKQPRSERNSTQNTRSNISRHYDLSNEMFELFLDGTMTYSQCPLRGSVGRSDPVVGRVRSGRSIGRSIDCWMGAGVGPGSRVLEIGTGWGELAIRAAQRGATVRSVTLSVEQQELAAKRISAAGLADRVQVDLLDYRQVQGEYDAVVSVEMIEAVGHQYWGKLLPDDRRPAGAGWARGDPSHHDAARSNARDPQHLHLGAQVHFPRRISPVGAGDRGRHRAHDNPAGA